MADLSYTDKRLLEELLEMKLGYVLDLSNRTFAQLVLSSTGKNIWDDKYAYRSSSKANRLRCFWDKEDDQINGKLLKELLKYWEKSKKTINGMSLTSQQEKLFKDCQEISDKLCGLNDRRELSEDEFSNIVFKNISASSLNIDVTVQPVIAERLKEINSLLSSNAMLSAIILCGSTLEGILMGIALAHPEQFNRSTASPKKDGKVLPIHEWKLSNLIDVAFSLGLLDQNVMKFSHVLREFRNYIHPYQQAISGFNPDKYTAKICCNVLNAAIDQLSNSKVLSFKEVSGSANSE